MNNIAIIINTVAIFDGDFFCFEERGAALAGKDYFWETHSQNSVFSMR
jgi:hypothetical protein